MKYYTNCKTYHTGLYKPHTILINDKLISIVYQPQNYYPLMTLYAIAIDENNNSFEIMKEEHNTWTGYLAFPKDPQKIKGLFPWL